MTSLRNWIYVFLVMGIINLTGCAGKSVEGPGDGKLTVAVSIVPQKTFVEAVAKDLADVVVMIPPGYSPVNHQPSPGEMEKFGRASLYFTIGVPAEEANILPKARELNNRLKIVPLADIVGATYPHRYFDQEKKERDPHIWLSPKRVKLIVDVVADELGILSPENRETFEKNARDYINELDALDREIGDALKDMKQKAFIVYHPAFGYFAEDYGLEMIAVEQEGKEATARDLQRIIDIAREKGIKAVFYQAEIDSAQSRTLAEEIGGTTEQVAPLAPDYIDNLRKIANTFKNVLQ